MLHSLTRPKPHGVATAGLSLLVLAGAYGCAGDVAQSPDGGGSATGGRTGGTGGGQGGPGSGGSMGGSGGTGGGDPQGGTGGGGPAIAPPPSALPPASACVDGKPGPRVVRRLSASEFSASIRTIFNDTAQAAPLATVFADPVVLGFSVDANALLVQDLNAGQLMDNAEAVAAWAVANNKLGAFASCTTHDATCGRTFVKGFGARAFRGKLDDADTRIDPYVALFMAEATFSDGAQAVMTAMLQSPYFLYRSELGGPAAAGSYDLTAYEVASSLSYLLTGNMPDDTLMAAADNVAAGRLTMAQLVDQQAMRLLAPSEARRQTAVMTFMNGWLGLDRLYTTAKDDTVYMLTKEMRDDMAGETRSLVMEAFDGNGGMSQLLTADHTFVNKNLGQFYGLNGATGTSFVSVPLGASAARGGGILAQASVLIGYSRPDLSSPTQRGHMVRSRMLCQEVPPPPINVDTTFKPAMTAVTTRDHYEKEHAVGNCRGCHQLMDQIGFGFEKYDGFGRYRTTENGAAINDSGMLVNVNAAEGSPTFTGLSGPGSLQAYLAGSQDMQDCLVRYWSYYAFGSTSWSQDACTYTAVRTEAAASGYALKSVLMGLMHAPHFTHRVQDQ